MVYEVLDPTDVPVGLFLGDFYTRPGKQGGAWMESLVAQNRLLEQLPVVVNNLNLAKPPAGQPTLLEHGRDPHPVPRVRSRPARAAVLGRPTRGSPAPRCPRTSSSTPRRSTRCGAPIRSCWPGYARHVETGDPLPADQIAALQVEGGSDQARETVSFLAATWLDLAWHRLTEAEVDDAVRDIDAFEARVLGEVGLDMAAIPPRYRSRYFNHIFSSGYAAGYYSYIWSEILDADTVEWFAEHRDRLREAGDVFRAELLSRGGSGDEMGYFEAFRGRPPRIEPLLRRREACWPLR